MDGILNIYKEKGFTSHDVVAVVRRTMNQKKVGHTGTLDPEAEGVLPVCLGKATKLADYIMADTKTYVAEVTLGITTTTQDHTGEVLSQGPVTCSEEAFAAAAQTFVGDILQVPPMYSALKVGGKKLYELAREGKEVERKPRPITIYAIRLLSFDSPKAKIEVVCSKGTYIRTLCADIGEKLGCGAIMSALERTATGSFTLETAIRLDALKALAETGQAEEVLLRMDMALKGYPKVTVSAKSQKYLVNGGRIYEGYFESSSVLSPGMLVRTYDHTGLLTGLFEVRKDERLYIKPVTMLL